MTQIIVINQSAHLADTAVEALLPSAAQVLQYEIVPIWLPAGDTISLTFGGRVAPAGSGNWQEIFVIDNATQAGALGFHEYIASKHLPVGYIFYETTVQAGYNWEVTFTHELFEEWGDAKTDQVIWRGARGLAKELCDPCEDDRYAKLVNGHHISDWLTPNWFASKIVKGQFADGNGHMTTPMSLLPGGYYSYVDRAGRWHQAQHADAVQSRETGLAHRPGTSGRSHRRMIGVQA